MPGKAANLPKSRTWRAVQSVGDLEMLDHAIARLRAADAVAHRLKRSWKSARTSASGRRQAWMAARRA
jgi:hypothetical protein